MNIKFASVSEEKERKHVHRQRTCKLSALFYNTTWNCSGIADVAFLTKDQYKIANSLCAKPTSQHLLQTLLDSNTHPRLLDSLCGLTSYDVLLSERVKYKSKYLRSSLERKQWTIQMAANGCPKGWIFTGQRRYTCVYLQRSTQTSTKPLLRSLDKSNHAVAMLFQHNVVVDSHCVNKPNVDESCGRYNVTETAIGECLANQFLCKDGHCISSTLLYDRHPDCPDGSDEVHEEDMCSIPRIPGLTPDYRCESCYLPHCVCGPHYHQSDTNGCVAWDQVCDTVSDCTDVSNDRTSDGSISNASISDVSRGDASISDDNTGNGHTTCGFVCTDRSACLIPDCRDGRDEDTSSLTSSVECGGDVTMIPCQPGHPRCYPIHAICVYDLDLQGHQRYCRNGAHLHNCMRYHCPSRFKCANSYCVPVRGLCDGKRDCPEGEDEVGCGQTPLRCPGLYRCQGGRCIHQHEVCDGHVDCDVTGEDEVGCDRVTCPTDCQCHRGSMTCHREDIPENLANILHFKITGLSSNVQWLAGIKATNELLCLDMSRNTITRLHGYAFKHLLHLQILILSTSGITYMEKRTFEGLKQLKKLDLQFNPLTSIDTDLFAGLTNVEILDLSNQGLVSLPGQAFSELYKLTALNLSHNFLKHITLFHYMANTSIDISDNPLEHVRLPSNVTGDWLLVTSGNYLCCMDIFNCHAPESIFHLCPSDMNSVLKMVCILYAICLVAINFSLALIIRFRTSRSESRVLTVTSCLVDTGQGGHILLLMMKDVLWDIGTVHKMEGPRHLLCVFTAWLQLASSSISICIKTLQAYIYHGQASSRVVGGRHSVNSTLSLLITHLGFLAALPIVLSLFQKAPLPDVSAYCTFIRTRPDQWWIVLLVSCFLVGHVVMASLIIWFGMKSLDIIRESASRLAEFGMTSTMTTSGPWRLWTRAYISLCVEFVALLMLLFMCVKDRDTRVPLKGVWVNIIYSLPSLVQAFLQIHSLCSKFKCCTSDSKPKGHDFKST